MLHCVRSTSAGEDLLQLLVRETEMRRRAEQAAEEANNERASTEQLRTMQARQIATLNGTVADLHKQLQQYQLDSGDVVRRGFSAGTRAEVGFCSGTASVSCYSLAYASAEAEMAGLSASLLCWQGRSLHCIWSACRLHQYWRRLWICLQLGILPEVPSVPGRQCSCKVSAARFCACMCLGPSAPGDPQQTGGSRQRQHGVGAPGTRGCSAG